MAADQVKPEPEKTEAAPDASDSAASTESTEQEATTAALQNEVQSSTGLGSDGDTASTSAGTDSNDNGANTTDAIATGDQAENSAEAEDPVAKMQKDGMAKTLSEANLANLTPAQRAELIARGVIPKVGFTEGADSRHGLRGRQIDIDGRQSLREGESRTSDDAVIKHEGKTIVRFDDADVFQGQMSADIDVNLPDNAVTRDIEGVGKHSVIQGEDGSQMEIIQANDGTVHIRKGGEYVSMSTGFNGQVTEGADAQKSFEALAEKIESEPTAVASGNQTDLVSLASVDAAPSTDSSLDYAAADEGSLSLPAMRVESAESVDSSVDGVREINVDGRISVEEGKSRFSDDAIISHEGQTIVEFDDADMVENQWSADIKVTLPPDAQSKTVEGAGKHSLLEGKDGVSTEVIEAEDGSVYIRKGNEYISMSTGFNGQVTEGAEAKAAFEAEAKKYDVGANAYEYGMIHRTNRAAIQTSDGQDLVTVGHDGRVSTNIPEGSYMQRGEDNTTYAMLKDGTEMIVGANGATMVRNSDGSLLTVSKDGQVAECSDDKAWKQSIDKFGVGDQTTIAQANDQDNREIDISEEIGDSLLNIGSWYGETESGGYKPGDLDFSTLDSAEIFLELGAIQGDGNFDLSEFGLENQNLDLAFDWTDFDKGLETFEGFYEDLGEDAKEYKPEDGLREKLDEKFSKYELPGSGSGVDRASAMLRDGIPGVEPRKVEGGEAQILKMPDGTEIKRLESENGNVMLEFPDGSVLTKDAETGAETWTLGRGSDGKIQTLRRVGQDTWSGHFDGMDVARANGAESRNDSENDFDSERHGRDRNSGRTRDTNYVSDGEGTTVKFDRNGDKPTEIEIGDQTYHLCPETGALLGEDGQPVQSGNGIKFERNENGDMVIQGANGTWTINSNRAVFEGNDGTIHRAGKRSKPSAVGTIKPTRVNPNFGDRPDSDTGFEHDEETAADGEPPTVSVTSTGVQGPEGGWSVDPETGVGTWTDADGNPIGSINLNTGVGQVGDFKFHENGVEDTSSGLGFNNGDIFDYNTGSVLYSESGGWADGGHGGRTAAQQAAFEAAAESKATSAVGMAQAVSAKICAAVASGNVSAIMGSMGEVAAAYGAISGAVGCAIQAGDMGLAGMLNLQTSQVNAAASSIVATTIKVQEVNRQGGDLTGDSTLSKALTNLTWSTSNPLIQRAQIMKAMGRGDDPSIKHLVEDTQTV